MSISLGSQKNKSSSSQKSQQDPWDATIPALKDLIGQVQNLAGGNPGPTAAQTNAFNELKTNAAAGNPHAGQIDQLASDMFGTQSQSGTVSNEFADYKRRLTPTADGANLDIMNDPQLAAMLQQVGDDAANRINSSFAAGGRTGSGANQSSVARGVTQAQLPILVNQLNAEKGRTDAAIRDIFTGGNTAAGNIAGLDAAAQDQRAKGVDVANAALAAENYGPEAILNLEEQMKNMPVDYLSKLAAILFPAGQLGQQSTGSGSSTSKSTGIGVSGKLI